MDRILYVEDEDANWDVTELNLKGRYILERARNAEETFNFLRREVFDLILMDVQLTDSEYDGIEICRILKQLPGQIIPDNAKTIDCRRIPIVFVTAFAERFPTEELKKAGGDDVITKPVDFTRLKLVTAKLLIQCFQ